jgi:hypothetical protein
MRRGGRAKRSVCPSKPRTQHSAYDPRQIGPDRGQRQCHQLSNRLGYVERSS